MNSKKSYMKKALSYTTLTLVMLLSDLAPAQAAWLSLYASGTAAGGIAPQIQVYVNGTKIGTPISIGSTLKYTYVYIPTISDNYAKGNFAVDIAYINNGTALGATPLTIEKRSLTIKAISIIGITVKNGYGQIISLPSFTVPNDSIRYDIGSDTAAFDDKEVFPFSIYASNITANGALRFKLSTGLTNAQMGLVINDNDPYSVEIGEYYRVKRSIPLSNIVHVKMPIKTKLTASEFSTVKAQIDAQLPQYVQAVALAWEQPFAVECNSITSAITFGFKDEQCKSTMSLLPTNNPYYRSSSKLPFFDLGIRPSMLLAAYDVPQAKALIDKGFSSNKTYPSGTAYLMYTSDAVRNRRASMFNQLLFGKLISPNLNVTEVHADFIQQPDILFYFQGLAKVPNIGGTNKYIPGSIADNLTSFGGVLDGSTGQTVILDFIKAGATGSFGTVSEPAAFLEKFPNPEIAVRKYISGETLIESYWKSVKQPYQGLFVGDPLANPWETLVATPDRIKPTTPYSLSAGFRTDKMASMSWKIAVDNVSFNDKILYKIYRDGVLIKDAYNPSSFEAKMIPFTDNSVSPSTTYTYEVAAYDEAGNVSLRSNKISITTLATPIIGGDTPIGGSTVGGIATK